MKCQIIKHRKSVKSDLDTSGSRSHRKSVAADTAKTSLILRSCTAQHGCAALDRVVSITQRSRRAGKGVPVAGPGHSRACLRVCGRVADAHSNDNSAQAYGACGAHHSQRTHRHPCSRRAESLFGRQVSLFDDAGNSAPKRRSGCSFLAWRAARTRRDRRISLYFPADQGNRHTARPETGSLGTAPTTNQSVLTARVLDFRSVAREVAALRGFSRAGGPAAPHRDAARG